MMVVAATLIGLVALLAASRKWSLPGKRTWALALPATAGAWLAAVAMRGVWPEARRAVLPAVALASQLALFAGGVLLLFYRDPLRHPPGGPRLVVSPADGKVIYVRRLPVGAILQVEKKGTVMGIEEFKDTNLSRQELWQVGISLAFTDVHVNRAPIAGRVTRLAHRPGSFLSLRRPEAASCNERQTLVISGQEAEIGLVQVASRLVRRIQAFVPQGSQVTRGQRIGMIKFGSQVDLFIPAALFDHLQVTVRQRLRAGETVICELARKEDMAGASGKEAGHE